MQLFKESSDPDPIEVPVKQFDFGSRLHSALLGNTIDCWTVVMSCLQSDPPLPQFDYIRAMHAVDNKLMDDLDITNDNALVIKGTLLIVGKGQTEKDFDEARAVFRRLREPQHYPQVGFMLESILMVDGFSPAHPRYCPGGTVYSTQFLESLAFCQKVGMNLNSTTLDYAGPMLSENPPFSPKVFAQFCRVFGLLTPLLKFSLWHPDAGKDVGLRYHLAKLLEIQGKQDHSDQLLSEIIKEDLDSLWRLIFEDQQLTIMQRREALKTLLEQAMQRLPVEALMMIATFFVKSACALALNNVDLAIPLYTVLENEYLGKEPYSVLEYLDGQSLTSEAQNLRAVLALTQVNAVLLRSERHYDQGEFGWVCKMLMPLESSSEAMLKLCEYLFVHRDTIPETVLSKSAKEELSIIFLYQVGMPKPEDSRQYKRLLVDTVLLDKNAQDLIDIIFSDTPGLEHPKNTAFPYVVATHKTIPSARRTELIERLRSYGEFCSRCHQLGGAPCLSFREYYEKQPITAVIDSLHATIKPPIPLKEGVMYRFGLLSAPDNSYDFLSQIQGVCHSVAEEDDIAVCVESICEYLKDPATRLGPNTMAYRLMEALAPHSVGITVFKDWLTQKFSDKDLRDAYCAHLDVKYCETRSTVIERNDF